MKKSRRKNKNQLSRVYNAKELKILCLEIFRKTPSKIHNYKQISARLNIKDSAQKQLVNKLLLQLAENGKLEEISRGKYRINDKGAFVTGIVEQSTKGFAFIKSNEIDEDVFITQKNLKRAFDGDTVKIYLYATRSGKSPEGEVVEIVKRSRAFIVGTIEISKDFAFLIPTDRKIPYDIFIPKNETLDAYDGDIVKVEITEWPTKTKNPIGKVVEVFGAPGENNTEIHAILAQYNLPYSYPEALVVEAEKISEKISKEEIAKREDFREKTTFTIDPEDAKDFDDALSVVKLKNGNYEVGVHIADVTHYIREDSKIDREGQERATSVYLVDRVVPMLPERLSNFICSLRPNEEKLCYSVIFQLDDNAKIKDYRIKKTIINSDKRFTYANAQEVLDKEEGDFFEELNTLNILSKKIRKKRFKKGAINFDRTEVKFNLDEDGTPLGIHFKESLDTNHLIEEFMLLANKYVAKFIGKQQKQKTFVYRIHDKPDGEKIQALRRITKQLGYQLTDDENKDNHSYIKSILVKVKGKKEQALIETIAIRSMAKAEYNTTNIGHYGLHFDYYTHFTSPIRRYPDMMVHRLLFSYINGESSKDENKYADLCKHSSKMENLSSKAERDSIKYKQVEFMSDKIGEKFTGIISGVAEWGIYVEIDENKCEGLVPIRDMTDDFYLFDEQNYTIVGKRHKKKYQLGDKITIEIAKANIFKKQLDFLLI